MKDSDLLKLIKGDDFLKMCANRGSDDWLASAAIDLAPLVPSEYLLTHSGLARLFGTVEADKIAKWFADNSPTGSHQLENEGIDICAPRAAADFAAFVKAGALTQEQADEILKLSTMQDTIDHEQVSRVLNPLRAKADKDGVARAVKLF